nr:P-loop NTPase fold protein [uncultured Bdellovibrio sp.]
MLIGIYLVVPQVDFIEEMTFFFQEVSNKNLIIGILGLLSGGFIVGGLNYGRISSQTNEEIKRNNFIMLLVLSVLIEVLALQIDNSYFYLVFILASVAQFLIVVESLRLRHLSYVNHSQKFNINDAISSPEEDLLGRAKLAFEVLSVIEGIPNQKCFRIGIFGEWGAGKTSLMNLLERKCKETGHVTVWINPWHHHTSAELWNSLTNIVQSTLSITEHVMALLRERMPLISGVLKTFNKGELASALMDLQSDSSVPLPIRQKKATQQLNAVLPPDKKLIVFVDDLDRAEPEVVHAFFLSLKEFFDIPQIVFVMGISREAIDSLLKQKFESSSQLFLDKLIDYSVSIPQYQTSEQSVFIENIIGEVRKPNSVLEILELIPNNPRSAKKLIFTIKAEKKAYERFDDEEVLWSLLYFCTLLKIEFPTHISLIENNKYIRDELFSMSLIFTFDPSDIEKNWTLAENSYKEVAGPLEGIDEFLDLLKRAAEKFHSNYQVIPKYLFDLKNEAVPSQRELKFIQNDIDCNIDFSTALRRKYEEVFPNQSSFRVYATGYLDRVVDNFIRMGSLIYNIKSVDERVRFVSDNYPKINQYISMALNSEMYWSGDAQFSAKDLRRIIKKIASQPKSNTAPFESLNNYNIGFLEIISNKIQENPRMLVYAFDYELTEDVGSIQINDEMKIKVQKIYSSVRTALAKEIVELFKGEEFVSSLQGPTSYEELKILLTAKSPLFRDTDLRQSFLKMISTNDQKVTANCYSYLMLFLHAATSGLSYGATLSDVLEVLTLNPDFFVAVARSGTSTSLADESRSRIEVYLNDLKKVSPELESVADRIVRALAWN